MPINTYTIYTRNIYLYIILKVNHFTFENSNNVLNTFVEYKIVNNKSNF